MSLQKSLSWMAMAQAASIVLQFAASVVLARLLTPHEFGIFAVALAVSGVLSLIQALGLQALIVREPDLHDDVVTTAFTVNALIAVAVTVTMLAASVVGGAFLQETGVRQVLSAIAFTPLASIAAFLPMAQLERRNRFKELALSSVIGGVAGAGTTVTCAVMGLSYMSFAYGQWAQNGIFTLAICIAGRAFIRFKPGFRGWRRVADFGLQTLAVTGVSAISGKLSDVVLGRFLGLSALGLYSRATSLNGLLWTNIYLVLGRVLLVDFAEIFRRGDSLRDRYMRSIDIISVILWPAFLGLAIVARPFIAALYGEKWIAAAAPLSLLAIASCIQVSIAMAWELFACTDNLRTQTRLEILRALIAFAMFSIGCLISLEAAALARVLDALVAYVLYRPHINRMTDTRTSDYLPIYLRNAVLAAVAVTPSLAYMAARDFSASISLAPMFGTIAAGIILWTVCLIASRHPLIDEVRRILKSRRLAR